MRHRSSRYSLIMLIGIALAAGTLFGPASIAWPAMSDNLPKIIYLPTILTSIVQRVGFSRQSVDNSGKVHSDIYTVSTDGSNLVQVTSVPRYAFQPDWSPDGRKIAFVGNTDSSGIAIYVMDVDGSNLTRLTQNEAENNHPSWSPDGQKIVFAASGPNGRQIRVMDADGTQPKSLTPTREFSIAPAWSPDGTRIAFISADPVTDRFDVYVMNSDGSGVIRLTHSSEQILVFGSQPAWSPDSRQIVFCTGTEERHPHVAVMNADGSEVKLLTAGARVDAEPDWSPDGAMIAFQGLSPTDYHIYVMNTDGSNMTQLTSGSLRDSYPAWVRVPTP